MACRRLCAGGARFHVKPTITITTITTKATKLEEEGELERNELAGLSEDQELPLNLEAGGGVRLS